MKLKSKVDGLKMNLKKDKMFISIIFDIDLELYENSIFNKKRINVEFDNNGKIVYFPKLEDSNGETYMKYIAIGKAIEEIVSYEGDRIKNVYDNAMQIYNTYNLKRDTFLKESNYNELKSELSSLNTAILDKMELLIDIKKEERKEVLRKEIEDLQLKKDLIDKNKIAEIESILQELKLSMIKSISNLEI